MIDRLKGLLLLTLVLPLVSVTAWADPPGRVGRIGHVEGQVWWSEKYDASAEDARRNWPITNDNVIATGDGRAEIRIGSTSIALDRDSEIEFARLDDEHIRVRLLQGRMAAHLRSAGTAKEFEVSSPFGRVRTLEPGRYRFDVDRDGDRGGLTVFEGHARFDGSGPGLAVREGETLHITGSDGQTTELATARQSEFDDWYFARDRRGERRALRYVPAEMTGYEDLDDYGDWRDYDDHGTVWFPRGVSADWAPYREGRWAWVEPWGWTWIDDMPWGFAPFHYGRWALIGGHWAWVPGHVVARPVYSPALVVWIGSPRTHLHIGATPAVGWFPLGPREVFIPAYKCSREHLRRINLGHVHRVEHTDVTHIRYVHRDAPRAVTVVSSAAVSAGRPVQREVVRIRERSELRNLLPAATPGDLRPESREHRRNEAAERWRERHRVVDRERVERRPAPSEATPLPGRQQAAPGGSVRSDRFGRVEQDRRRSEEQRRQDGQRIAEEERRRAEERRQAEERVRVEERRQVEERQRAEDRRRDEAKQRAEAGRRLEERRIEERQRLEQKQRFEAQGRAEDDRRAQEEVRRRAREQENAQTPARGDRERRSAPDAQPGVQQEQRRAAQEQHRKFREERRQELERQRREGPRSDSGSVPAVPQPMTRMRENRQLDPGRQEGRDPGQRERREHAPRVEQGAAVAPQSRGKSEPQEDARAPRSRRD